MRGYFHDICMMTLAIHFNCNKDLREIGHESIFRQVLIFHVLSKTTGS